MIQNWIAIERAPAQRKHPIFTGVDWCRPWSDDQRWSPAPILAMASSPAAPPCDLAAVERLDAVSVEIW